MKIYISILIFILFTGCSQRPIENTAPAIQEPKVILEEPSKEELKRKNRIDYLKKQAEILGYDNGKFVEVKNLFGVISAIQEGRLTSEQIEGFMFYFDDSVGSMEYVRNAYAFSCLQVIEQVVPASNTDNDIGVYKALYFHNDINMTVSVMWGGTRPLKGQLLNVDFLQYSGAGSYENKEGELHTELLFIRPKWAGLNGSYPQ